MITRRWVFAATLLGLLGCVFAGSLGAQQTCIPVAQGIPPFGGPPNWWDPIPPQPVYAQSVDDPRWQHSASLTYTTDVADFRAIYDASNLYLSWRLKTNSGFDPQGDALRVVFGSVSGTLGTNDPDVRIEVWPFRKTDGSAITTDVNAQLPLTQTLIRTGAASSMEGWSFAPDPAWLTSSLRVWGSPTARTFAVHMRVPRAALGTVPASGITIDPASQNLRLWFEFQVQIGPSQFVRYTWPRDVAADQDLNNTAVQYPWTLKIPDMPHNPGGCTVGSLCFWFTNANPPKAVEAASELHLYGGMADPAACSTVGVSLAWDAIGTENTEASRIEYKTTGPQPQNWLFAHPLNKTGTTIPSGALKARFRIANWGSAVLPQDWEVVPPGVPLWTDVPGGSAVQDPNQILDGGSGNLRFMWQVADPFLARLLSGDMKTHQCMLVELTSTQGLTFINSSVYRNMDFVHMSRFTRDAEISVVGLEPTSDGESTRDVYLYVETLNMPKRIAASMSRGKPVIMRQASESTAAYPDSSRPTYRVHVFHDTETRIRIAGRSYAVLRPQGSFGYYPQHDGDVSGWRHRLTGPVEELAPNFYRVRVPHQGVVKISTTIEALGPKPFGISLHAGLTLSAGNFKNAYDRGVGATFDLERRLNNRFGLAALLGYHRFDSTAATVSGPTPHLELYHVSGSLAMTAMSSGWVSVIVDAGGGMYWFKPGTSKTGAHAGVSLEYLPSLSLAVGLSARAHNVFTGGSNTRFAAIQAGGRLMF